MNRKERRASIKRSTPDELEKQRKMSSIIMAHRSEWQDVVFKLNAGGVVAVEPRGDWQPPDPGRILIWYFEIEDSPRSARFTPFTR